jgi:hypothetical protein
MVMEDIISAIRFAAVWISGQSTTRLYPEVYTKSLNDSGEQSQSSAESVLFLGGSAMALDIIGRLRFLLIPQATSLL